MSKSHPPPEEFRHQPVPVKLDGVLDLHGFRPKDVSKVVADYLNECHARGIREIRVIHGRGIGELRRTVRHQLGQHPLVERFADATPAFGGHGATILQLIDARG